MRVQQKRSGKEVAPLFADLETQRGAEIYGSQSSLEDWAADLSHCNFVSTRLPAERSMFIPVT